MDFPKSVPNVGLVDNKFIDENPVTGSAGSLIPAVWGNSVTFEILNVLKAAGIEPDESLDNQLSGAISKIISASLDWNNINYKPTTIHDSGITDVWSKGETYSRNESYSREYVYNKDEVNAIFGGVVRGDYCTWVGFSLDNKDIPYMRHKASNEAVYLATRASTLGGYGITNAYTIDQVNSALAIRDTNFTALAQEVGRRVVMGGGGLNDNVIRIGYLHAVGAVRVHVDSLDFGNIWTDLNSELSIGRVKLPNGFTLMTGTFSLAAPAGSNQSIYFPVAFSKFCMGGWAQVGGSGAIDQIAVSNEGTNGMIVSKGNNDTFARVGRWFAIGE